MFDCDLIIVGGGIAGLYCAYKLPHLNIILIEKRNLGGRIFTYSDDSMTVEAGGARFNKSHVLLLKLLDEFRLTSKIQPIPDSDPLFVRNNDHIPFHRIQKILDTIVRSKRKPSIHTTFLEHAASIVSENDLSLVKSGFGYSAELEIMNAHDACNLIRTLSQPFYTLQGGLSQLVHKLAKKLKHVTILHEEVVDVAFHSKFEVRTNRSNYTSRLCVAAVPVHNMESWKIGRSLLSRFKKIKTTPLCRIYANVEPGVLTQKIHTDSDLRMIIPITKTVAMVSYTDSEYARTWKRVLEEEGNAGVKKKLVQLYKDLNLPVKITHVKMFYWPSGVGYWGVGAESEKIEFELLHPFLNVPFFICGENVSSRHQQWIEGALDTAEQVVEMVRNSTRLS
jgi:monoamine oxidase